MNASLKHDHVSSILHCCGTIMSSHYIITAEALPPPCAFPASLQLTAAPIHKPPYLAPPSRRLHGSPPIPRGLPQPRYHLRVLCQSILQLFRDPANRPTGVCTCRLLPFKAA